MGGSRAQLEELQQLRREWLSRLLEKDEAQLQYMQGEQILTLLGLGIPINLLRWAVSELYLAAHSEEHDSRILGDIAEGISQFKAQLCVLDEQERFEGSLGNDQ
jgi:hypothetical protein